MPSNELYTIPGWRAVEAELAEVFPGRLAGIYRRPREADPSELPLTAVLIHRLDDCLHYFGLGLSDLFEKSDPASKASGWGFELTFRLARAADDESLTTWPISLLQMLARRCGPRPNRRRPTSATGGRSSSEPPR